MALKANHHNSAILKDLRDSRASNYVSMDYILQIKASINEIFIF